MLVQIDSAVVVGPRNSFNEVVIIGSDDLANNILSNDGALLQTEADANSERLVLNLNSENTKAINLGTVLSKSVQGIMDYSYGNYKVNVFGLADLTYVTPSDLKLVNPEDSLSLASYNIENFSRLDENSRTRAIATDISKNLDDPDILILHEVMDDSGTDDDGTVSSKLTLTRLVDTIEEMSGTHYTYIDFPPKNDQDGGIAGGNIRSVILYQEEAGVSLVKVNPKSLLTENPTRMGESNHAFDATRKPGVALFSFRENPFLLITVHLTSRSADSPLFGNEQPIEKPEEEKRVAQAAFIHQYLDKFQKENPKTPIIVAGDFNDDPWSETLNVIKEDLLVNLNEMIPASERYSYILDGNAIQLDQILTSSSMDIVSTFTIPHLNTVYDQSKRASDHDPVIAVFNFKHVQ